MKNKDNEPEIIAETRLVMRDKDGQRRDIHIEIGRPYEVANGGAACPLAIYGLYGRVHDIGGVDTFQALALALKFVRLTLRALQKKGISFYLEEEGEDCPIQDIGTLYGGDSGALAVIGIGGASCAGKTVLAEALAARLGDAVVVGVDSYYRDLAHLALEARASANFDEPAAVDHELLVEQVRRLRAGRAVEQPVYDFATHTRRRETRTVNEAAFVIVEGLLALYWPELRGLYDASVFVTAPDAECLARRTARDVRERGRTAESVRAQYEGTVRPMFEEWCAGTEGYADLVLDGCGAVEAMVERVVELLRGKGLVAGGEGT